MQNVKKKKQVRVVNADNFSIEEFGIKNGDVYDVISEKSGEKKYGYLIYTKKNRAIVLYSTEVEVIEK